jgi:predicted nucleotidyltransferase
MLPIVQKIGNEYKAELKKLYGDELSELILFGSYARGDFHAESDIDFALVLKNPNTRTAFEIFRISDISTDLSLKYGLPISSFPIAELKLKESKQGVFQEIRKEGIKL